MSLDEDMSKLQSLLADMKSKNEPSSQDWESFDATFANFQKIKRELESLSEKEEKLKASIREFVVAHGTKEKPGTNDAKLLRKGFQIHNLAVKGRVTSKEEEAQIAWLKKSFPQAITTKTVEIVDQITYESLKRDKKIPSEVLAAFGDGKVTYQLRVRSVGRTVCDAINNQTGKPCGAVIGTSDKFCRECGSKLIFEKVSDKESKEILKEIESTVVTPSGRKIEID